MGTMRYGINQALEAEANALIRGSLEGVTRHCEKSDILTPWKEKERLRREVYVPSGSPDGASRRGMFHRPINQTKSHLNSRDGRIASARDIGGSLSAFIVENGLSMDARDGSEL